jgi:hypothetical protein
MSWAKLLADKRVTALPPSKAELDILRSNVARCPQDVESAVLSADARFVMAYDAARTLSLLIVAGGRLPTAHGGRTLQHVSGAGNGRSGICNVVCLFRETPLRTELGAWMLAVPGFTLDAAELDKIVAAIHNDEDLEQFKRAAVGQENPRGWRVYVKIAEQCAKQRPHYQKANAAADANGNTKAAEFARKRRAAES